MERQTSLNIEEDVSTKITLTTQNSILREENLNSNVDNRPISEITDQTGFSNCNEYSDLVQNSESEQNLSTFSYFNTELKNIKREQNDLMFCIVVDGSEHSDFAFNLVVKEFINNNKLLVVYVYDSALDEIVNYRNRKDTIISKYSTMLESHFKKTQYEFIQLDKNVKEYIESHTLDLANRSAYKNKANFLFCGYGGIKGPRGDNQELSKGINYLLINSRIPTVIVKEGNLRKSKNRFQKGYKWLFVFDRTSSESIQILTAFLPLIDKEMDSVHGLTLLPSYINFDDYKKTFFTNCDKAGLKTEITTYESEQYKKNSSDIVIEKINFGEKPFFDFVVFYNNPERIQSDKSYDVANIILKSVCNVCFINAGIYRSNEDINTTFYN